MNTPPPTGEALCLKECPFAEEGFAQRCEHPGCTYIEFDNTATDALGGHTAVVEWAGHCAMRQA